MYLKIDSRNRINGNSTNFDTNTDRFFDDQRFTMMRIINVFISGSRYNIDSNRNYLNIEETFVDLPAQPIVNLFDIYIPAGNYSITDLASTLQSLIRDRTNMNQFLVTCDLISGKLTFDSGDHTHYYFSLGGNFTNSAMKVIGFDKTDTLSVTSIQSQYPVDLSGCPNIDIRSSLAGLDYWSDKNDNYANIICTLNVKQKPWENITESPLRPLKINTRGGGRISFTLVLQMKQKNHCN